MFEKYLNLLDSKFDFKIAMKSFCGILYLVCYIDLISVSFLYFMIVVSDEIPKLDSNVVLLVL